jgi:hypothetical protein
VGFLGSPERAFRPLLVFTHLVPDPAWARRPLTTRHGACQSHHSERVAGATQREPRRSKWL